MGKTENKKPPETAATNAKKKRKSLESEMAKKEYRARYLKLYGHLPPEPWYEKEDI